MAKLRPLEYCTSGGSTNAETSCLPASPCFVQQKTSCSDPEDPIVMGKNQAHKAMQRTRYADTGADDDNDKPPPGTVQASADGMVGANVVLA